MAVSKHHYAECLAKMGNNVFFLNPPTNTYSLTSTFTEGLKILDYPGFWMGLHILPKILRRRNVIQVYERLQTIARTTFDVVWSFDNSVFFDLDLLPKGVRTISHIVDFNQDFQFKRSSKAASLCLSSTKSILTKQLGYNTNSFKINHGVAIVEPKPILLPETRNLKIGYAGNLEISYIDWELLSEVARGHPSLDFFLAGKFSTMRINFENVHYLGPLEKPQLSNFYDQMDVLIVAYKADQFKEQLANPHKIMEYLYTGKTIVASYTEEYDFPNSPLVMSRRNDQWLDLFNDVVLNFADYCTESKMNQRKEFALENTYEKQVLRIDELLEKTNKASFPR